MSIELMNALLAGDMDEIEDLPDFGNPATGSYMFKGVKAELGEKESNDGTVEGVLKVIFKVESCLEEEPTPEQQASVGILYSLNYRGENGVARFKRDFRSVGEALGTRHLMDVVEAINNELEMAGAVKRNTLPGKVVNGEKQDDRQFTNIVSLVVAG